MPSTKSSTANQFLIYLTLLLLPCLSLAASKVQYFNSLDCQQIHVISDYTSSSPSAEDTACHASPAGTLAIWIDSLDAGCTARTYSDSGCATALGLSLTPGTCYLRPPSTGSPDTTALGSFRIVCGATDANNPVPDALVTSTAPSASGNLDAASVAPPIEAPSNLDAASVAAPMDPLNPGSTWTGSTDAEALGRPSTATDGDGPAASAMTNVTTKTTTESGSGSVTVDPLSVPTTLIVTGTGGGRHTNSTGLATWSNTFSPSTRTSTSTVVVTGDVSSYTGDGRNNGGGASSGIRPGQGGASGRSTGRVQVALLVMGGLFGLSWGVLW